jgi:hypothetical protein
MRPDVERQIAATRRQFLLPWLGAAFAVLVLAGLGFVLTGSLGASDARLAPLPKMMTVGGLIWSGLILILSFRVLAPDAIAARLPAPDAAAAVRQLLAGLLVLWSAAAAPAILGIAQILAGGDGRTHFLLCAASIWVLAFLMPAQAKLASRAETAIAIWEKVNGGGRAGDRFP